MIRPTKVETRKGYGLWLQYSDGTTGEVDLSHLAGRGVFAAWKAPGCFEEIHIVPHGAIAWGDDLELCPDALYMPLTGKSVEELMPDVRARVENA